MKKRREREREGERERERKSKRKKFAQNLIFTTFTCIVASAGNF